MNTNYVLTLLLCTLAINTFLYFFNVKGLFDALPFLLSGVVLLLAIKIAKEYRKDSTTKDLH